MLGDDGPESHLKKSGTPTMGGIIIVLSISITCLFYLKDNQGNYTGLICHYRFWYHWFLG